jgi:hypothetical protein
MTERLLVALALLAGVVMLATGPGEAAVACEQSQAAAPSA